MLLNITEADGELIEREIVIEPLNYIRRDTVLKIDEVHLIMANKNLVWVLEREQIVFGSAWVIQPNMTRLCSSARWRSRRY
jgi:hypothetical protein